jgi:hypothetical protein
VGAGLPEGGDWVLSALAHFFPWYLPPGSVKLRRSCDKNVWFNGFRNGMQCNRPLNDRLIASSYPAFLLRYEAVPDAYISAIKFSQCRAQLL